MSDGKLFQLSDARKEKQENLKRDYERVLFRHILGCYTVIEKLGLKSVEMIDISKSGCSFRLPVEDGAFAAGEEFDFRFYFSNKTYVPCRITVRRVQEVTEAGYRYYQYGCTFDTSLSSFEAMEKFVDFINAYGACAKEDKGDKQVWFL
jgi:hypothetical protein